MPDALPLFVAVGQRDPRVLVQALDTIIEAEFNLTLACRTGDWRSRLRRGRARERDVPLPCGEPRGRVEADPAGAGNVDLGPRVQVREVLARAARAIEGLKVRRKLDEIARNEARREAKTAHDLDEQPAGRQEPEPRCKVCCDVCTPGSMRTV